MDTPTPFDDTTEPDCTPVVYHNRANSQHSHNLMPRRHKSALHLHRDKHTSFQNSEVSKLCTYERRDTLETKAYRPMTSNGFRHPYNLSDPINPTHYESQYYAKDARPAEPIRTGTSSGNRANKPHPLQEFMVFRFKPMKQITNPNSEWSLPIGDKLLSQIIQNQFKSTYASDYVNNVEEKARFEEKVRQAEAANNMRRCKSAKYSSQSTQQFEPFKYNTPFNYESLNISPTRYACNKVFNKQAVGIVPELSKYWLNYGGIN